MLFDPLEEEFDLPTVFVEVCDGLCGHVDVVGQEIEGFTGGFIIIFDTAQPFWIVLICVFSGQHDDLITFHTWSVFRDWTRITATISGIRFGTNNEESPGKFEYVYRSRSKIWLWWCFVVGGMDGLAGTERCGAWGVIVSP